MIQLKQFARQNRKQPTKAEGMLWHMLLKKQKIGYRFVRQKPLGRYIVDFYCPKLRLVIELDGRSHENTQEGDYERDQHLNGYNITVIRYTNHQITKQLEGVYHDVLTKIGQREQELQIQH